MNRRSFLSVAIAPMALPARAAAPSSYSVALVSGGEADGRWHAGVLVKLESGWKTYWRVPGDAGVPPQFDWSRSENVGKAEVAFPLPTRFRDASGEGIGYHDEILFPVTIMPGTPARKVVLRLDMFFAVCRDICIPARAAPSVDLTATPPNSLVEMWQARVPVRQVQGPIKKARLILSPGKPLLALTIDGLPSDIFIEGSPTANFGKPELDAETGEHHLAISGLKDPLQLLASPLTATLAFGASGIEQSFTLT
jgi:DsbC/DsbD-like thiol-disulfide interchange protein